MKSVYMKGRCHEGSVGARPRAPRVLLGHQGPPRGVGAARAGSRNHRKVRRQEELIWLIGHGFTHVVSILDSPHNLHAYEEAGVPYAHVPLGRRRVARPAAVALWHAQLWLAVPRERVLIHHEEFGDRLLGVLASLFLCGLRVDQ